jgi:isopentenyl-diphosphate delta-isomerase
MELCIIVYTSHTVLTLDKIFLMSIKQRKKDHVELSVSGDVQYAKNTGFESFDFAHTALPEVNFDDVSTEAILLGRSFSFPLFISSMTGGYTEAGAVNAIIAEFCEEYNLPFGVGSQRIMLEDPEAVSSFSIVRQMAPSAFIASNIGGAQLIGGVPGEKLNLLIDSIEADAVIVHLNPLQELVQPEGDRNFKGIERGIAQLAADSPVPVIVKETGAGISGSIAERLLHLGVAVIDTAGAGGTSWARVENRRTDKQKPEDLFDDWGIPTVECLKQVAGLKQTYRFELIASGGLRTSLDMVKALCLGANFTAVAQPVIKAVVDGGSEGLRILVDRWKQQVKIAMTLLGCQSIDELNANHLRIKE